MMASEPTFGELCEWTRNIAGIQADVPFHFAYHAGQACPFYVVAEILAGMPDPRDGIAEWRVDITGVLKPNGSVPLSLNDRGTNPFAVANAKDRIKARVRNAVRDAQVPQLEHVHVELHYRPKTNAHRDPDNIVATLKPCIDALHQPDEASRWDGILAGDDPRYASWSQPLIHRKRAGEPAALWLILRSEP